MHRNAAAMTKAFMRPYLISKRSSFAMAILKCGFASYSRRKRNHYDILDIPYDATENEIKNAFVEKSQQLHPDGSKFGLETAQSSTDKYAPDATEQFMQLKTAYDVLRRPTRRKQYDRLIGTERLKRYSKRAQSTKLYDDEAKQSQYTFWANVGMTAREFISRDFYVRLADSTDNSLLYFTIGGLVAILILQGLYVWYLESTSFEKLDITKKGRKSSAA